MASINFFGNVPSSSSPSGINHGAGSGLGFYGISYGTSVPVGQYQDSTWVTNANGTATDRYELNNIKYMHPSSGRYNNATTYALSGIPNYYAPLNIRFTHSEAVKVQNCKLRIFDRVDVENHASGVDTQVYEVRHPSLVVNTPGLSFRGTGTHTWVEYDSALSASPADYTCTNSPGISGLNTDSGDPITGDGIIKQGAAHESTRHDWYVALSASPHSVGSKTDYGLYFTCEYL